jgi:predicted O-methyltransferase YrrM
VSTLSKRIYAFFGEIQKFPVLSEIPFIYKVRGCETYPLLDEQDQWKELGIAEKHVYLTNQFDDGLFEDIYRYSLTKVKRKCQIRDAYDLFQCLEQSKDIAGDIIEFGTYEGHSGLLMAEYIKKKNLPKKLYLCDTFKEFPKFDYGIDKPWSHFHNKNFNFAHVKSIFKPYEFVTFVKGDFRETLRHIPCDSFSFAYVDCDSYEATRFVSDFIYPKLSAGGCIVFEDYGHHSLLGARRAVDEFTTENRNNLFSFFSFFSGLKIVIKRK